MRQNVWKLKMGCASSRQIFPSDSTSDEERPAKNPRILVGDVTTKKEKKKEREMKMKEKQEMRNSKALEMSGRIMEEKERLSLGERSRGTSRATSRAGSPTPTSHKQVHFRPDEVKMMNSSIDSNSSYRFPPVTKPVKSSLKNQNDIHIQIVTDENGQIEKSREKNFSYSNGSDKLDSGTPTSVTEENNGQGDNRGDMERKNEKGKKSIKLSTIEERANSRCSTKSEDVKKG
ncbi:uncharacterized protein [Argopecten irradians]|uniref:uncharacterized protein n=1 Tax=Argopecten irradians TaxID=31199 RepID=UPI00371FA482